MRPIHFLYRLVSGLILIMLVQYSWSVAAAENKAYLVEIDGAIDPVSQELIVRGIDNAEAEGADMVILQMNTPGGLDHSLREIIKAILGSRIPVGMSYISLYTLTLSIGVLVQW